MRKRISKNLRRSPMPEQPKPPAEAKPPTPPKNPEEKKQPEARPPKTAELQTIWCRRDGQVRKVSAEKAAKEIAAGRALTVEGREAEMKASAERRQRIAAAAGKKVVR
jgi:hypothetical protein